MLGAVQVPPLEQGGSQIAVVQNKRYYYSNCIVFSYNIKSSVKYHLHICIKIDLRSAQRIPDQSEVQIHTPGDEQVPPLLQAGVQIAEQSIQYIYYNIYIINNVINNQYYIHNIN